MQITTSQTRMQFPLSPKKIIKKTIAGSIVWIILAAICLFFSATLTGIATALPGHDRTMAIVGGSVFMLTLVLLTGVVLLTYFYQRWYYAVYFYDLTPDHIIIRKGPITPREINIPYERVQDVYVDQDLFDRLLGIYDVHLSSATVASGSLAHIDGVEKPAADGLRAMLLDTVGRKIGKKSS